MWDSGSLIRHSCLHFGIELCILSNPCCQIHLSFILQVRGSHVGTYLPNSGVWQQTQRFIKKGSMNAKTVSHLDFDAPTREQAQLLPDDKVSLHKSRCVHICIIGFAIYLLLDDICFFFLIHFFSIKLYRI